MIILKKAKQGMTLVEVIASVAIIGIVSVAIMSILVLTVNRNADNKAKLYANENLMACIELIKTQEYRPKKVGDIKEYKDGWYYMTFDNNNQIENFIKNSIDESGSLPDITTSIGWSPDLVTVKSKSGQSTQSFVIALNIRWNGSGIATSDKVYEIDIYSWEVVRGELSKVSRKILLAPQV